jgi:hypothetical protein
LIVIKISGYIIMNLVNYFSGAFGALKPIEWAAAAAFIIYIVFPISTPAAFVPYIDTPFSMFFYLMVTLALFFYSKPILGILYILVIYELLSRSTQMASRMPLITWTPSQAKMDAQMQAMAPAQERTLEEDVIAERGPIDVSRPVFYSDATFKPVSEPIWGASLI